MAKYCTNCGAPLRDGAKFCVSCGKQVPQKSSAPQKATDPQEPAKTQNEIKTESQIPEKVKTEPEVKADIPAEARKKAEEKPKSGKEDGFFATLKNEIKDLIKHPKKMIPTIVLSVVWIVLPLVMGFAPASNLPFIRFIATLTYANGGVFGGFFGTLGGIFGKAIFAAVVNGLVLSLLAKKNPFKNLRKGFSGVLSGGAKAISPFLLGGGIGFLLYFFFNVTSAPQNCAIAVVCVISLLQSVARQNGLLFAAVFFSAKTLSKGKAPTRASVNRLLSGLIAAFVISFPVTFLRYPLLIALPGLILTVAGIVLPIILKAASSKKTQEAAK